MGRDDFIRQLRELGYEVTEAGGDLVSFPYPVPVGRFEGRAVTLGFVVPGDFPATPPGGPHVSPRLLPLNLGGEHPGGRIHESPPFGADWEYWSRPFPGWPGSGRTVRAYMAHVRKLFATQ